MFQWNRLVLLRFASRSAYDRADESWMSCLVNATVVASEPLVKICAHSLSLVFFAQLPLEVGTKAKYSEISNVDSVNKYPKRMEFSSYF